VCGTADQTPRDVRDDVVLFESDELAEPTAVVGQIFARLFVSSSAKARPLKPLAAPVPHRTTLLVGVIRRLGELGALSHSDRLKRPMAASRADCAPEGPYSVG
jgi:hypothetical protein